MDFRIGKYVFDTERTHVMGILNVTPDSFSDGGQFNSLDAALRHVQQMVEDGAAVIDVGGESTRPGYQQIPVEEEIERVVPVIEAIWQRFDVPISVDTYKAPVARAALEAGADMINDIWGLKYDPQMGSLIAQADAACCLMHNREPISHKQQVGQQNAREADFGTGRQGRQQEKDLEENPYGYKNFMDDVVRDLRESLRLADGAGINRSRIITDPGVGFAKSYEQNLAAIREVGRLKELGCPVLLGTSRKSVIGLALDLGKGERLEGTLATTVYAVLQGCMFVRVHDVRENVRAIRMTEAILCG